jgi:hypothetical protein
VSSRGDILSALNRWSEWHRIRQAPDRLDELEKRLARLDKRLSDTRKKVDTLHSKLERAPGEICSFCGARAARLTSSQIANPDRGLLLQQWTCASCGRVDDRLVKVD